MREQARARVQVSKRERGESKKCKGQEHARVSAREGKIGSKRGKEKERERLKGNGRELKRVHVDNTHGASKGYDENVCGRKCAMARASKGKDDYQARARAGETGLVHEFG